MQLQNKTALITGGGRGIGLAFARRYVDEGARVAIADIDVDRAQAAAETDWQSGNCRTNGCR